MFTRRSLFSLLAAPFLRKPIQTLFAGTASIAPWPSILAAMHNARPQAFEPNMPDRYYRIPLKVAPGGRMGHYANPNVLLDKCEITAVAPISKRDYVIPFRFHNHPAAQAILDAEIAAEERQS